MPRMGPLWWVQDTQVPCGPRLRGSHSELPSLVSRSQDGSDVAVHPHDSLTNDSGWYHGRGELQPGGSSDPSGRPNNGYELVVAVVDGQDAGKRAELRWLAPPTGLRRVSSVPPAPEPSRETEGFRMCTVRPETSDSPCRLRQSRKHGTGCLVRWLGVYPTPIGPVWIFICGKHPLPKTLTSWLSCSSTWVHKMAASRADTCTALRSL